MRGASEMCERPKKASRPKNTTMIGPKNDATRAVPLLCTTNSPTRITTAMGRTKGSNAGDAVFRPSTADSTEIAGVITASPANSAAPVTPSRKMIFEPRPSDLRASAISDSVPPSPLLSARIRKNTYLRVTTMNKAQISSETMPITSDSTTPSDFMCASAVFSA